MKLINPEVRIENTSKCNAHCAYCPREKMTRPKVTMPMGHFKKMVNQAKELGAETISIFGYGEPLMDKALADKVEYCTHQGLDTFITTNGSLLFGDETMALLTAGLKHIRFSVHGFYGEYNQIHKRLDYNLVIRNIFNFVAMNKKFGNCKISVTVIPQSTLKLKTIVEFWEPYCEWLEIWKPHNWTDGRSYRKIERKKKTCNRPFTGPVQINADGKMMVCCFDYDAKLTVGDTHEESIENILKGEKYNAIRRKHESGDLKGLICESCDQLNEEEVSPLLYSSRDSNMEIGRTSSTKFKLKEIPNGINSD